ncbi:MAG: hypothetical protein OXH97_04405 [Chloroflexota bacterium]|nr:hypothetical protein [Chloroflexota bacterium]
MQDRYAGDIGDFGKYGLLRWLCGDDEHGPALKLGVLWYRVPNEKGNNDGSHTGYVHSDPGAGFQECDKELFRIMKSIVCEGKRTIGEVEVSGALPTETFCHSDPLCYVPREPRPEREERRCRWIAEGRRRVIGAQLVFADPDNGLQTEGVARHEMRGRKYAYYDDLAPLVERGQSLVVYHHLGRQDHKVQIKARLEDLRERLPHASGAFGLRFRRGTARAFLVLPTSQHAEVLRARAETLLDSAWGINEHFDRKIY